MMHAVRIELTGPGRGKVFLDDRRVEGVTDLQLSASILEMNTLQLTLAAASVQVDASAVLVDVKPEALEVPSYFEYNARRATRRAA